MSELPTFIYVFAIQALFLVAFVAALLGSVLPHRILEGPTARRLLGYVGVKDIATFRKVSWIVLAVWLFVAALRFFYDSVPD